MNKWIKCSDRLPEKDGRYLVFIPYNGYNWIGVSQLRKDTITEKLYFDDELSSHWMDLPEPPK